MKRINTVNTPRQMLIKKKRRTPVNKLDEATEVKRENGDYRLKGE